MSRTLLPDIPQRTDTVPYRPSNGTEGEMFYAGWCAKCQREGGARQCKIFTATLVLNADEPGYPKEWIQDAEGWPGNPRCTAFEVSRTPVRHRTIKDKRQRTMDLGVAP